MKTIFKKLFKTLQVPPINFSFFYFERSSYLVIDWLDILDGDNRMNFDQALEGMGNRQGGRGFQENRNPHPHQELLNCCMRTGRGHSLQ